MSSNIAHFEKQSTFRSLRDTYQTRARRLVAFCGAGASFEAGLPDWSGFVAKLRDYASGLTETEMSRTLVQATLEKMDTQADLWKQVQTVKALLNQQFENAVRSALTPTTRETPTFYRRVWDLSPAALITLNLDGYSRTSFAQRATGILDRHYTGTTLSGARDLFVGDRPLIVELHGTIEVPDTWILTKDEYDNLSTDGAYTRFLQTIFSVNTVLFYGVDFSDPAVADQLNFLKKINLTASDLYVIRKRPDNTDGRKDEFDHNIRPIWLPDELSWEDGFSAFVDAINVIIPERQYPPVINAKNSDSFAFPTALQLLQKTPDEARKILSGATARYFSGETFEFEKYREFCREYDLAINHASRVRIDTSNNTWLGHELVAELGAGNFGKVYLAAGTEDNTAIKVAHDNVRDNEAMLNSFRRGVNSMRLLSSSNINGIVKLKDAAELPPSIIMEHVDGIDFEKYVANRNKVVFSDVVGIIHWVSEIILSCHMHSDVILHRDLRPSNIMIRGYDYSSISKDDICILDFDLSWFKGATGDEYYMSPRNALGYLAPEQLNPASKTSARSALVDVYGIGMLFYFGLSGDHPSANASSRYDWQSQVEHACTNAYSKAWRSLPALVSTLILDCTREAQSERIPMQSLIERIRAIISIHETGFIANPQYMLIELFYRIYPPKNLTVNLRETSIKIDGASGFSGFIDPGESTFTFELDFVESGSTKRANLGKYLGDAYSRAKDAAAKVGRIDEKRSQVRLGGMALRFTCDIPLNTKELDSLTAALSKVIGSSQIGV